MSCSGEYLLLRVCELCERRFRHYVGGRASGWHAAVLPTLWTSGSACGGSGPQHGYRATRLAMPDMADVGRFAAASEGSGLSPLTVAFSSRPDMAGDCPRCIPGLRGRSDYRLFDFTFRHPPALLLAMICFNMTLSAGALTFSPRRIETVRAVLLS